MIQAWEIKPDPIEKQEDRHRLLIQGDKNDVVRLAGEISTRCSSPFTVMEAPYNWGLYLYEYGEKVKKKLEKLLGGKGDGKSSEWAVSIDLNPHYTFETFVVGPNNAFAHGSAMAVAHAPGKIYNPLYLYGGVGLGKTHLMQAIGHRLLQEKPDTKALYVSTERFIKDVIDAVKDGILDELRSNYRALDLLMVDDIQFLGESESTQEEFFHTFNTLYDSSKQIIIASDKPPKRLSNIEERLKSRFEWGLIADIKRPELETRIAILKKKCETLNLKIADEILDFIARKLTSNIRELEGFLKRINAYVQLSKKEITMQMVEELMSDLVIEGEPAVSAAPPPQPEAPPAPPPPPAEAPSVKPEQAPPQVAPAPPAKEAVSKELSEIMEKEEALAEKLEKIKAQYFYPAGQEKLHYDIRRTIYQVAKKHKMRYYVVGESGIGFDPRQVNDWGWFVEQTKQSGVEIAVVVGFVPISAQEYVADELEEIRRKDNVSVHLVRASDATKEYTTLNLLLDIAVAHHGRRLEK